MIFNENGMIINEGLLSNIKDKLKGKKKEEVKYLSQEDNKIIADKYDDSNYYKVSLTKIFTMCKKEDEDDIIFERYTKESIIDIFKADIFKLVNPRNDGENNNRFFNVGIELCSLINEDINKQYPDIKIEMEEDMDWDDFYYGCKIKYLLKM